MILRIPEAKSKARTVRRHTFLETIIFYRAVVCLQGPLVRVPASNHITSYLSRYGDRVDCRGSIPETSIRFFSVLHNIQTGVVLNLTYFFHSDRIVANGNVVEVFVNL